jgi:hypothetical protein
MGEKMIRNIVRGVLSRAVVLLPKLFTRSNERQLCVFVYKNGSGREERFVEVSE